MFCYTSRLQYKTPVSSGYGFFKTREKMLEKMEEDIQNVAATWATSTITRHPSEDGSGLVLVRYVDSIGPTYVEFKHN